MANGERAISLPALRSRRLEDAGLGGPALVIFKSDARSRVWLVRTDGGAGRVIKRFQYTPLRQRAGLLTGNHPAWRELRCNRRLQASRVPVVPIVDGGVEPAGLGCRVWLATAATGRSLDRLLAENRADRQRSEALIDAAVELTASLVRAGFWMRDLKPSNMVIDEAGRALLIDTGSAGRWRSGPRANQRMLALMERVMTRDGVEPELRRRYAAAVCCRINR